MASEKAKTHREHKEGSHKAKHLEHHNKHRDISRKLAEKRNPELKLKQEKEMSDAINRKKIRTVIAKADSRAKRKDLHDDIRSRQKNEPKSVLDQEKFAKLKKDKTYFERYYANFNKQICAWLRTNNNFSVSLIERESTYDINAKSPT